MITDRCFAGILRYKIPAKYFDLFAILFIIFILLSLIVGRLDTVYGLREEELRNLSSSNPIMREIHSNIAEIKNELKELKNQNSLKSN
ncbi:MAG: hypothetical protein ABFS35_13370 [Bacteroidota bacterium]